MILVKASTGSDAALTNATAAMVTYHAQLAQAGVLLDGAVLRPRCDGWRIRHADGQCVLLGGSVPAPVPMAEELLVGYTLIQVRTREEAVEWTRRFPAPQGPEVATELEVRPLHELDDFGADSSNERFRQVTPSTLF
jgi:hypothetical protein